MGHYQQDREWWERNNASSHDTDSPSIQCHRVKQYNKIKSCLTPNYEFKAITFNVRSIYANFEAFENQLNKLGESYDVITLTECWLESCPFIDKLPGYTEYKTNKIINQNSGVVVYVRNKWKADVHEPDLEEGDCLVVKIPKVATMVSVYRPPSCNVSRFSDSLAEVLDKNDSDNLILTGDINIDLNANNMVTRSITRYRDIVENRGLVSAIHHPTRKEKILDHFYVKTKKSAVGVVHPVDITDHSMIMLGIELDAARSDPQKKKGGDSFEKSHREELAAKTTPESPYTYNAAGKPYCPQCDLDFKTMSGLASHMRSHDRKNSIDNSNLNELDLKARPGQSNTNTSAAGQISCPKCDQVFLTKSGLASHMRAHDRRNSTDYSDLNDLDGKARPGPSNTNTSAAEHTGQISCPKCDQVFQTKSGLASHMRTHDRKNSTNYSDTNDLDGKVRPGSSNTNTGAAGHTGQISCPKCDQVFQTKSGLASHMRAHDRRNSTEYSDLTNQDRNAARVVPQMKKEVNSFARLLEELDTNTRPGSSSTYMLNDAGQFSCPQCGQVFKTKSGLASHMKAHDRRNSTDYSNSNDQVGNAARFVPQIKMGDNSFRTRFLEEFDAQTRSGSSYNATEFSCPQCGQVCKSKSGLASHMRAHDRRNNTDYPASSELGGYAAQFIPQMSFGTRLLEDFDAQTRSGSSYNATEFSCPQCGQMCKSKSGLASHMRAHERRNNTDYSASSEIGGYAARSIPQMSYGSRLLENFDTQTTSSSSYTNTYNATEQFYCPQCGREFKARSGLASHMRAHERRNN